MGRTQLTTFFYNCRSIAIELAGSPPAQPSRNRLPLTACAEVLINMRQRTAQTAADRPISRIRSRRIVGQPTRLLPVWRNSVCAVCRFARADRIEPAIGSRNRSRAQFNHRRTVWRFPVREPIRAVTCSWLLCIALRPRPNRRAHAVAFDREAWSSGLAPRSSCRF